MTDQSVSRRQMIGAMASAGALGMAGCIGSFTGGGGDASGTVKIGVLQPLSGDLKYYGLQSIWGFATGLAHKTDTDPLTGVTTGKHTVEGEDVTYELYVRDTKFSAKTAKSLASNLVQNEEVDVLFGCSSSASASRVIKTVVNTDAVDIPYLAGPAASASITSSSKTCSDQVFRASENTAMDARSGGKYVATETDVESVFLMGADYSFGKAVVNNYETVLKANGVKIAGKKFVPQKYDQFDGIFQSAVEKGADAVVGGFTVATLPNFLTTGIEYDVRIFGGFATKITNAVVGGLLQNKLGKPLTKKKIKDAKIGPFTTRYHWNQYDNEINTSFVDTYTKAYGKVPDLFTSGTFTAASALVQAVEESGSTSGAEFKSALKGMTVSETPKGKDGYTFQTYDNQARSEMTIAYPVPTKKKLLENKQWNAAMMPGSPIARVPGKEATIPKSDVSCSL